ncbi:MAG: hypothetical protein ACP5I1_05190, partial [Candidatus Hinthialibacter sp.]
MAKKKKKHTAAKTVPPPKPSAAATFVPAQWRSPVFSAAAYYKWASYASYALTGLLFLVLTAYFTIAHSVRPRILDLHFVQRLLHPPKDQPAEIYRIGPPDSSAAAQSKEGNEGILFRFGPGAVAGFLVSTDLLHLPAGAQNLGLSIHSAYKGSPAVNYGFTNQLPSLENISWYAFLADNAAVVMEIPPNETEMKYFISMPAHYYTPDQFKV